MQLAHLLVYNAQWIFKIHGATTKIINVQIYNLKETGFEKFQLI